MKLSDLPGIGDVTEKKLAGFGIIDVIQLLVHSPREISELTGMDSDSSEHLFIKAREALEEEKKIEKTIQKASDIEKERKNVKKISTGCKALDKLLLGGLEVGATTEIYGEFGSGKSQFCHTMAVRVILDDPKATVCWIDTENTFRPERIRTISESVGLDADKVMENIYVGRVRNSVEQRLVLEDFEKMILPENVKLIIIDSTMGLFRSEYIGRGSLSDRQGQINRFVGLASHISRHFNIPIIFTNQVLSDPSQMFGDPTKPTGGNVVAHTSTYRVYFKKSGKYRIARMVDSPHHPDSEVNFALSTGGVVDVETKDDDLKASKKAEKKKEKSILDDLKE